MASSVDHREIQNKVTNQVCGSLMQVHLCFTYTQVNSHGFETFLNVLIYSYSRQARGWRYLKIKIKWVQLIFVLNWIANIRLLPSCQLPFFTPNEDTSQQLHDRTRELSPVRPGWSFSPRGGTAAAICLSAPHLGWPLGIYVCGGVLQLHLLFSLWAVGKIAVTSHVILSK